MSSNEFKKCDDCNVILTDEEKNIFECGHLMMCKKCISINVNIKFGEKLQLVSIDKTKIYDFNDDEQTNKSITPYKIMSFGTPQTSGIICCPTCKDPYSILTQQYKTFGIPKKIKNIILFKNENIPNETLYYHICSSIDLIHLISMDKQKNLLKKFNFENENTNFFNNFPIQTYPEIMFINENYLQYHADIIEDFNFVIFDKNVCPVCNCNENDNFTYKHATIQDLIIYFNRTNIN